MRRASVTPLTPDQQKLVEDHVELARVITRRLWTYHCECALEDLFSAAYFGLVQAAQRYDDTKGAKFSTYMTLPVAGAVMDDVRRERAANGWSKYRANHQLDQRTHRIPWPEYEYEGKVVQWEPATPTPDYLVPTHEDRVAIVLSVLPDPRKQRAFQLLLDGLTYKQVGARLGRSEPWAHQVRAKARQRIDKLRAEGVV